MIKNKCEVVISGNNCPNKQYKNNVCKKHYDEINDFVSLLNNELAGANEEFTNAFAKTLSATLEEQIANKLMIEKYKKH